MDTPLIESWFDQFKKTDLKNMKHDVVEVLSDSSNEQYLNARVAQSFRSFGRREAGYFWVRTEWEKTDICWGFTDKPFASWERAWADGRTGIQGQVESKVVYGAAFRAPLETLVQQLEDRREVDSRRKGAAYANEQQYHGLVWFYSYSENGHIDDPAAGKGVELCKGRLERVSESPVYSERLTGVWPVEPSYEGRFVAVLMRLPTEAG